MTHQQLAATPLSRLLWPSRRQARRRPTDRPIRSPKAARASFTANPPPPAVCPPPRNARAASGRRGHWAGPASTTANGAGRTSGTTTARRKAGAITAWPRPIRATSSRRRWVRTRPFTHKRAPLTALRRMSGWNPTPDVCVRTSAREKCADHFSKVCIPPAVGLISKLQETTDILRGLCTPDIPAVLPVESGLQVRF